MSAWVAPPCYVASVCEWTAAPRVLVGPSAGFYLQDKTLQCAMLHGWFNSMLHNLQLPAAVCLGGSSSDRTVVCQLLPCNGVVVALQCLVCSWLQVLSMQEPGARLGHLERIHHEIIGVTIVSFAFDRQRHRLLGF